MVMATGVTTRSASTVDESRLKMSLYTFLDVPHPTTDAASYAKHEIVRALTYQGIVHFRRDFLSLSENDIRELVAPDPDRAAAAPAPISLINKRRLIILLAFYHHCCAKVSAEVKIENIPRTAFDDFRTMEYDPNSPIRPWKTVTMTSATTSESELSVWKKSVRPNKSDYKEFRDESLWVRSKEQFTTTLESHSLAHLIDDSHVVTDADLDQAQRGWLYSVMQTAFKAPMAKTIVTKHLVDKDTRKIWKELCEYYDGSMTSVLRAQQISSYLTSTRLHNLQWKGSQTNFILHWVEQARIYNEISQHPFQEMQQITFLNSCLSGTPNLSQVLTLHQTAKKAAGIKTDIKMAEYVALLLDQAQVHDAGNTHSTNPRARRSVNTHEFIFEDSNPDDSGDTYEIFNTEIHDHETPIELLVNRTEQGPRRPRVDSNTWHSLTKDDQVAWDNISDKGKTSILTYAAKNSSKFTNSNGILKNSDKRTRFANDVKPRQAHTHEQSSTTENTHSDNEDSSNTTLQVSTHQLVPKPTNDFDDILTMATTKTTSKSNPNAHLTINSIMSTPTLESKVHETHYERTDYGLEAFVHTMRIGDVDYEVESDHDDDFSDTQEARLAQFDYSAYREEPTPTQIDLLDDASFLVDREQLNPEPESTETPTTVRLYTKEDLIQFHEDPQAEATEFPRPGTPSVPPIDANTFEDIEETVSPSDPFDLSQYAIHRDDEPFDFTKHILTEESLVIDDALLDQVDKQLSVEETKDYEEPYEGYQGMMKSPYQFVHKPPPTTSKIVLNEDKTKHIFVKGDDKLPRLEPIPPAISDDTPEIISQPFDFSQYIDHPEYIDDPDPFFADPTVPPDEPKFYEKPTVETDLEDDDITWELTTSKRKRKKKKSKGMSPSPSSDSSPSSQSETSSTANPKKDFRYAGSD
jgi:hypothetical protein